MTKIEIAENLAQLLRELADACIKAANGDKSAKSLLEGYTDSYWHGLVVGGREIKHLIYEEEEEE
jgi:hypothetical protein